jgi:hypothetical protein
VKREPGSVRGERPAVGPDDGDNDFIPDPRFGTTEEFFLSTGGNSGTTWA